MNQESKMTEFIKKYAPSYMPKFLARKEEILAQGERYHIRVFRKRLEEIYKLTYIRGAT